MGNRCHLPRLGRLRSVSSASNNIGSVSHYLVAGRELGVPGIATLAATEIGTITFMYTASSATSMARRLCCRADFRTGHDHRGTNRARGRALRALKLMTVPEYFERNTARIAAVGWRSRLQSAASSHGCVPQD